MQIEYRYTLKNVHTGQTHVKFYNLVQIESEGLKGLFDVENYVIIQRSVFTGLKDKNDNKIFSGDKLLYLVTNTGVVEIDPLKGVFATGFECYIGSDSFEKCKIIGNIHDKN